MFCFSEDNNGRIGRSDRVSDDFYFGLVSEAVFPVSVVDSVTRHRKWQCLDIYEEKSHWLNLICFSFTMLVWWERVREGGEVSFVFTVFILYLVEC